MRKLLLGAATLVTSLGLMAGVAAAQGGSISDTGPGSRIHIDTSKRITHRVNNRNDLSVRNTNYQTATTGNATVSRNTWGGDATTGNAQNDNSLHVSASVTNPGLGSGGSSWNSGGSGGGSISDTGPDSQISIRDKVDVNKSVDNNNHLSVTNTNNQTARSGNATVTNNTHGGSATTGDASNSNSTSVTFDVNNN